ncbi:MAG TPA: gluconokinase [Stellaceae bacterium]|nr:gluconokinase [Stellaceae bacterium]
MPSTSAETIPSDNHPPIILVVMGVSAVGKTTVARGLAERLGWAFEEGDDLHPPENVAKMKSGQPLDDDDRRPWLLRIGVWIDACLAAGRSGVVTCSALRRRYRDLLAKDRPAVRFVFLHGDHALLAGRIAHRHGHFMPTGLLDSQFATLEPPGPDENPISIEVGPPAGDLVQQVIDRLGIGSGR